MFEIRFLKHLDFLLLAVVIITCLYGTLMVFSATRFDQQLTHGNPFFYFNRQLAWLFIGLIACGLMIYLNYDVLPRFNKLIYLIILILLAIVLITGSRTSGAQRWISLGPFHLQPSEFAKIALIIILAAFITKNKEKMQNIGYLILSLTIVLIPVLLVFKQPDLGTALVMLTIWLVMIFIAGAKLHHIFAFALLATGTFWLMWSLNLIKPYQKDRLITFLKPHADPLGAGYQILQSKIAIGSGQILGKGLFQGTQTHLQFVPHQHTDFLFTALGEELGFLGCLLLLFLYFLLLWRTARITLTARDTLGQLLAAGILAMFAFQICVNIGMTMGIMPVTGVPLPFFSYGGSSLLTCMIAIGILNSIYMRRFKIMF